MIFEKPTKYIEEGLVTEKEHDTEPYVIYNYTPACQFEKKWDGVTMMCRGLIVHKYTREVIARPFRKFFNYEEHKGNDILPDELKYSFLEDIPEAETPEVYKKYDGSLGILYFGEDEVTPYIATRGSFNSDQAKWATEWYRKSGLNYLNCGVTFLFEIIYPENRIVVDYKDYQGLVTLASIDTETGNTIANYLPSHVFTSVEELKKLNTKNEEGFILYYKLKDLRVKIKFEDYVKLHKVMTGLSEKGIWEVIKEGKDPIEFVKNLPDEMYYWANKVVANLLEEYVAIENACMVMTSDAENGYQDRKNRAQFLLNIAGKYSGICFAMLDGKPYRKEICKFIRPEGRTTFRKDIDA